LTQQNESQQNDELKKFLDQFKTYADETTAKGKKRLSEIDEVMASVDTHIENAKVGSPEWVEWTDFRRSLYEASSRQFDLMINAINHYQLALFTMSATLSILGRQSPSLAEEVERIKEEVTKTVNDQIGKKLDALWSAKGHEAMYGLA
jgi:hypothetical protein